MQNTALRTATGCTQDTHIQHLHDETLTLPIHEYLHLTRHNANRKHNINHIPYTTYIILQHSKAKKALSLTTAATQQTFHRSPHSHYNRHKTNMRHIHTSNFSMHIASTGNNKLLRTPPPHISSSEVILPGLTRRIIAQQINLPSSNHTYTNHIYHHYALCNTHIHNIPHIFNCAHIRIRLSPLNLRTEPAGVNVLLARWTEKMAGGPQAGRSVSHPLLL